MDHPTARVALEMPTLSPNAVHFWWRQCEIVIETITVPNRVRTFWDGFAYGTLLAIGNEQEGSRWQNASYEDASPAEDIQGENVRK